MVHTMEYCSATKRNNAICSNQMATTREHSHTSEAKSQKKTIISCLLMNQSHTNELIYKTQQTIQTLKTSLWLA